MDYYSPGCATIVYKPALAQKALEWLRGELGEVAAHTVCCAFRPDLPDGARIINTCSGCDRRFDQKFDHVSTVTIWEIAAASDYMWPDYGGADICVQDACPTRHKAHVREAVRTLLKRMNFNVVENEYTMERARCCGDSAFFKPGAHEALTVQTMRARAAELPSGDICCYCVACVQAMAIGGKRPRYLLDLMFGEETVVQDIDTAGWHGQINRFIGKGTA